NVPGATCRCRPRASRARPPVQGALGGGRWPGSGSIADPRGRRRFNRNRVRNLRRLLGKVLLDRQDLDDRLLATRGQKQGEEDSPRHGPKHDKRKPDLHRSLLLTLRARGGIDGGRGLPSLLLAGRVGTTFRLWRGGRRLGGLLDRNRLGRFLGGGRFSRL